METPASHRRSEGGEVTQTHDESEPSEASPVASKTRWNDALSSGNLADGSRQQASNQNDAKSRWQRSGMYAERITGTDGRQEQGNEEGHDSAQAKAKAMAPSKQMEAQYWLELVDSKHRYGTNLKSYHDAWNKSDTKDNFFRWLDHGEGKDLDLPDCPREQLDKEKVTYLNAEQRKNYLVEVKGGMLVWHRTGWNVDTAKNRWEDLGHGGGIGRKGDKAKFDRQRRADKGEDVGNAESADQNGTAADDEDDTSSESSLYSSSDSDAGPSPFKEKHYKSKPDQAESRRHYWTSPRAVMDVVLRKTINANTWIYVCTTKGDLYVGIKSTGGFQHSSFMHGATVESAGLLKAKNGQLTSLSPLSGHYRAGTVHFKQFTKTLEEKGVDMSAVDISKSILIIGGIEKYAKISKKKKKLKEKIADKLHITTKEQKKEREEKERNEKIEAGARHAQGRDSDRDTGQKVDGNLHDDKRKEDLTENERAERAIALIQRAMKGGLKGEKKRNEKDAKLEDAHYQQHNRQNAPQHESSHTTEAHKMNGLHGHSHQPEAGMSNGFATPISSHRSQVA